MNQPRTEVYLPVAADELRTWAVNMQAENPIGMSELGIVDLELTDTLHAGVELTFKADGVPMHTLAIFGSPNEAELEAEVTG